MGDRCVGDRPPALWHLLSTKDTETAGSVGLVACSPRAGSEMWGLQLRKAGRPMASTERFLMLRPRRSPSFEVGKAIATAFNFLVAFGKATYLGLILPSRGLGELSSVPTGSSWKIVSPTKDFVRRFTCSSITGISGSPFLTRKADCISAPIGWKPVTKSPR